MRIAERPLQQLSGPNDPRVADAAERSPLVSALELSGNADVQELRFRENVEPYADGVAASLGFFQRKRVLDYLDYALARADIEPAGTVVELGAGSCWLSSALACFPAVERVIAIDFSRRRLTEIGPASLALLDAPAEKVERRVADFYNHGLEPDMADVVVLDAAFHHAADPARLSRICFDLLRRGGTVVLFREPTLTPTHRKRDHGIEAEHGDFEHEYRRGEYVTFLRDAGFDARSIGVRWFHSGGWRRVLYHPPLTLLSGPLRGHYVYVGRK